MMMQLRALQLEMATPTATKSYHNRDLPDKLSILRDLEKAISRMGSVLHAGQHHPVIHLRDALNYNVSNLALHVQNYIPPANQAQPTAATVRATFRCQRNYWTELGVEIYQTPPNIGDIPPTEHHWTPTGRFMQLTNDVVPLLQRIYVTALPVVVAFNKELWRIAASKVNPAEFEGLDPFLSGMSLVQHIRIAGDNACRFAGVKLDSAYTQMCATPIANRTSLIRQVTLAHDLGYGLSILDNDDLQDPHTQIALRLRLRLLNGWKDNLTVHITDASARDKFFRKVNDTIRNEGTITGIVSQVLNYLPRDTEQDEPVVAKVMMAQSLRPYGGLPDRVGDAVDTPPYNGQRLRYYIDDNSRPPRTVRDDPQRGIRRDRDRDRNRESSPPPPTERELRAAQRQRQRDMDSGATATTRRPQPSNNQRVFAAILNSDSDVPPELVPSSDDDDDVYEPAQPTHRSNAAIAPPTPANPRQRQWVRCEPPPGWVPAARN